MTGVAFTVFAFLTTQVREVRAQSPWQDDPYVTVASYTVFLVPTLVILILIRRWRGPRRTFQLLRATQLMTVLVAITVGTDAIAVAVKADHDRWGPRTVGQVWMLLALAVATIVSLVLIAVALRGTEDEPGDWLDDIPVFPRFVRANLLLATTLLSLAGSIVVIGALAIGEGWTQPLMVAFFVVAYAAGLFAFCLIANSVMRVAASELRLPAAVVGALLGIQAAIALRDSIWVVTGHDGPVTSLGVLAVMAIVSAIVCAGVVEVVRRIKLGRVWRIVLAVPLLLVGYLAVVEIAATQPIRLPAPTGTYAVGRMMFDWTDQSRPDPLGPAAHRDLSVWTWYPTRAHAAPGPYAPGLWSAMHFPPPFGFLEGSFLAMQGHSIDRAAIASGRFPLVVLEPGMGLSAPMFATIAENLASHGYVVAGVTPTYSANVTVVHGRVLGSTAAGNPDDPSEPNGTRVVNVWAADGKFAAGKAAARFAGHVDASRTLYIGHSFGGASALQECHLDAHCGGAIDLDGTQFGSVARDGVRAPVMIVGSDNSCTTGTCSSSDTEEQRERQVAQTMLTASPHAWCFSIGGTQHFNFTDYAAYYLAPPLNTLIPLGPIDGDQGLVITNRYVVAFADHVSHGSAFPPAADPRVRTLHQPVTSPR